ncbi:MAG: NosD domain-containing protein, partial [Candidatus Thorarchaeota archaeon]
VLNNYFGFFLSTNSNNTLINNTAIKNNSGFYLQSSNQNSLFNNFAQKNNNGFFLIESNENVLTNNTAQNNTIYGIFFFISDSYNTLTGNIVKYNTFRGIYLYSQSNNNLLTYNNILENGNYGIFIDSSSSNKILYNVFYQNNKGNTQVYSDNSANIFDSNYWSDLTTPDYNDDGIVNDWYYISGTTDLADIHPVTIPYSIPFYPNQPQDVQIKSGDKELKLTWNNPTSDGGLPIIRYDIYRSLTIYGDFTFIGSTNGTETIYFDSGLQNGILYFYKVNAINMAGPSAFSQIESGIPISVPPMPQKLQATPDDRSVRLIWSPPINSSEFIINDYTIYRSRNSSTDYSYIGSTGTFSTSFSNIGLQNGLTYYYLVRARNDAGESLNSNVVNATPIKGVTIAITYTDTSVRFEFVNGIIFLALFSFIFCKKHKKGRKNL